MSEETSRIYLKISFAQKDKAKSLGAKWDNDKKLWYLAKDRDLGEFNRALEGEIAEGNPNPLPPPLPRRALDLAFIGKEFLSIRNAELRKFGASYDGTSKTWSIPGNASFRQFARWIDRPPSSLTFPSGKDDLSRYLRYCDTALQQADLDKIVDPSTSHEATHDEFINGRLLTKPPEIFLEKTPLLSQCLLKLPPRISDVDPTCESVGFGDRIVGDQFEDAFDEDEFGVGGQGTEQIEDPTEDIETLHAVFIVFGYKWKNNSEKTSWKVPLAVPAAMSSSGTFSPVLGQLPLFNTEFFEPQVKKRKPLLGNISDLEDAIQNTHDFTGLTWSDYVTWVDEIFNRVTGKALNKSCRIREFKENQKWFDVVVVPYTRNDAMVEALHNLYATATSVDSSQVPLLSSLWSGSADRRPVLSPNELRRSAIANTGHMSPKFGLDPSQRLALRHLIETPIGRSLAISGPPGTGKTSMMQGVIATVVVNAALSDDPKPPIIIASSATNQAVTNVIKAFSSVGPGFGDATIEARWIPDLPSYGWYFPSRSKADSAEANAFQQLLRDRTNNIWRFAGTGALFQQNRETKSFMGGLKTDYLERFRAVFPAENLSSIEQVTTHLRMVLSDLVKSSDSKFSLERSLNWCDSLVKLTNEAPMNMRLRARDKAQHFRARMERLSRHELSLNEKISQCESKIFDTIQESTRNRPSLSKLLWAFITPGSWSTIGPLIAQFLHKWQGKEPESESLVRLRHEVRCLRRRLDLFYERTARLSCPPEIVSLSEGIGEILFGVDYFYNIAKYLMNPVSATNWTDGVRYGLSDGVIERRDDEDFKQGEAIGIAISQGVHSRDFLSDMLEGFLDRTIRVRCFNLAARYWEGRWLMEADTPIDGDDEQSVVAAIRQHCMLAPVIVATANMLPNLLKVRGIDELPDRFALSAADLLIIDEAGQVPPPLAVALFALAKRCVAVGDVEQLAPIVTMSESQDNSLLRLHKFESEIMKLRGSGLTSVRGSIMKAAQSASFFGSEESGITLLRHYRCRPKIIEFCNELVYKRTQRLIPMTREAKQPIYHSMSYVELDFSSTRPAGGSRENLGEAGAIIDWLKAERPAIEAYYNTKRDGTPISTKDPAYRDLRKLVALITPYAAQVDKLAKLVREAFNFAMANEQDSEPEAATKMVIGTVHSLQGAERPIVIFSPVSAPKDGQGAFMDNSTDMLNVAVSRAQDVFILFGNKELFFSKQALALSNHLPSATLGRYLRKYGRQLYPRILVVAESPKKANALQSILGPLCKVFATSGHFREITLVDFNKLEPSWRVIESKEATISEIANALDDMDEIVLATDDDREGEAIAWHMLDELRRRRPMDGIRVSRMLFHEVTKEAVTHGFKARTFPWQGSLRATAATTRALIDKVIGESLSRTLSDSMRIMGHGSNHSMGRVKAALLEFIESQNSSNSSPCSILCELDISGVAIKGFLSKSPMTFDKQQFNDLGDAEVILQKLTDSGIENLQIDVSRFSLGQSEPSSTSEILIRAYDEFKMCPTITQRILQNLYEGV